MPIYEFYCPDCNVFFNFYSKAVNTTKRPACPRCSRPELQRRMSLFVFLRGKEESGAPDLPDMDEDKLEKTMHALAREAEDMGEEDPRKAASLMRKLSDATGLKLGSGMEEAIRRMEAGEDPEKIEAELGNVLETEDPFGAPPRKTATEKTRPPARDDRLYEL